MFQIPNHKIPTYSQEIFPRPHRLNRHHLTLKQISTIRGMAAKPILPLPYTTAWNPTRKISSTKFVALPQIQEHYNTCVLTHNTSHPKYYTKFKAIKHTLLQTTAIFPTTTLTQSPPPPHTHTHNHHYPHDTTHTHATPRHSHLIHIILQIQL